jgi:UDP-N-acetylglucosamine transferase subunit ALG13
MIFLTVGTQFPFDRLVKSVDELLGDGVLNEEVFGQIGDTTYQPKHFQAVARLDKITFDQRFREASAIISHAGTGTITMAMDYGKSLLAMPRRRQYGEVVNDHQVAFADRFAALGYILVASDEQQLPAKVIQLKSFTPTLRRVDPHLVAQRIVGFLGSTAPTWRFHGLKEA